MKKILIFALLMALVLSLTGCACKHENTSVVKAVDATCTAEGYTGDVVCDKCSEVVTAGEVIAMLDHTEQLVDVMEATCTRDGYTGDTLCTACESILSEGEIIPATGHTELEVMYAREASCSDIGYTGDTYCNACGMYVAPGETIEKLEHVPGEAMDAREATCTEFGYSGDIRCTECNRVLEYGDTIEKLPHALNEPADAVAPTCTAEGYSGTRECIDCGEVIKGEILAREPHSWVDGVCSDCGWMEPGLYVDGVMQMTWEALVEGNYVTFNRDGELDGVHEALYGTLVIGEEVPGFASDAFEKSVVEEVYVPATIKDLNSCFKASGVKTVRFVADLEKLGYGCFNGCEQLESIVIPEGVTQINDYCFNGCSALHTVVLPETLTSIGVYSFGETAALTEIVLPEGLTGVDNNAFFMSGLKSFTAPSTLEKVGSGAFFGCEVLETIDLSAAKVVRMYDTASKCGALAELKLSAALTEAHDIFDEHAQIANLVIPDGVEKFSFNAGKNDRNTALRTVVWPVSLKEVGDFAFADALETVYYRGSEFEWSLVADAALISNAEIVYDYTAE